MDIKRKIGVGLATLAVATTSLFVTAKPAAADGFGHDAVIKAQTSGFFACQLYLNNNSGAGYCAGYPRYLNKGQNTKTAFGWHDADAIVVPPHANLFYYTTALGPRLIVTHNESNRWVVHKVSGCGGCTRRYGVVKF